MQAAQATPPRGFSVGAGVLLFGLSVEVFGLAVGWDFYGQNTGFAANSYVCLVGVFIVAIGLVLHIVRI